MVLLCSGAAFSPAAPGPKRVAAAGCAHPCGQPMSLPTHCLHPTPLITPRDSLLTPSSCSSACLEVFGLVHAPGGKEPGSCNVTACAVTAPHTNLVGTVAVTTRVADPNWHPPGPGWPPSLAEPPPTQQGRGLHSLSLSHHGGVVWHCPG